MVHVKKAFAGNTTLGTVDVITLSNDNGMSVDLLSLGATMQRMVVPSGDGTLTDVLLGYDTPQAYLDGKVYLGGTIGRYANRIGGASFVLDDQAWQVTANQDSTHTLHGGQFGYDKRIWDYELGDDCVTFTLEDLHLEEGFPGDVHVSVGFTLGDDNCLCVTHQGTTDRTTVLNITHHPYFNLNGHSAGDIHGQFLSVNAQFYTPCTNAGIPTGEVRLVAGSPVDLRIFARLSAFTHNPELEVTRGLDHNFVIASDSAPCTTLWSKHSGIRLDVSTTLPGVQVYTGGYLGEQTAKAGALYHNHQGVAIEPQFFPNAMNCPHFPSPVLRPEETYLHQIRYQFSCQ